MLDYALLSVTRTGALYLFELRTDFSLHDPPIVAVREVADEQRRLLFDQIAQLVRRLYHFYLTDSATGDDPDPLRTLGRLIQAEMIPPEISTALGEMPLHLPLLLSTNDNRLIWELAVVDRHYLGLQRPVTREPKLPLQNASNRRSRYEDRDLFSGRWKALFIGDPTGNLASAIDEVDQLADLVESQFPQAEAHLLCGPRATKSAVRAHLASGDYRIIHYSGHAYFGHGGPASSNRPGIAMLQLAEGTTLSPQEILSCLSGNPLVFLNACGAPHHLVDVAAPADAWSLNAVAENDLALAFWQAGAQAVIGTLWPVPDGGAAEFALASYSALLQGEELGRSMRAAKQSRWQAQAADPVWSAYVAYGPPTWTFVQPTQVARHTGVILVTQLRGLENLEGLRTYDWIVTQNGELMAKLAALIARFGGQVLRTRDSNLVAAFGSGSSAAGEHRGPDYGERATRAALAVQRAVRQTLALWPEINPSFAAGDIDFGIGLALGTVAANHDASMLLGREFRQATDLANVARTGVILATDSAVAAARGLANSQPWPESSASDLSSLAGTAINAISGIRSGMDLEPDGPLIGRQTELHQLLNVWQRARKGGGALVNIVGDAGMGKSRLVQAFASRLTAQGDSWLYERCHPHEVTRPYALVHRLMLALLGLESPPGPEEMGDALAAYLDVDPDHFASVLGRLFGNEPMPQQADQQQSLHGQIVYLLRSLLARSVRDGPRCIILEDLHNADELTEKTLLRLFRGVRSYRLLVIGVFRPNERKDWSPWSGERVTLSLDLTDLSIDEARKLLSIHLTESASQAVDEEALARWGGNPLFLMELARALDESGGQLDDVLSHVSVSHTVSSVVQSRIDRLEESSRQVLEAAAVLGFSFSSSRLAATLGHEANRGLIESILFELEEHQFLRFGWQGDEVQFRHELVQQAVYSSIVPERRREIHYQAGQALARRIEAEPEELARHYFWTVAERTSGESDDEEGGEDEDEDEEDERESVRVMVEEVSIRLLKGAVDQLISAGEHASRQYMNLRARLNFRRALLVSTALEQDSAATEYDGSAATRAIHAGLGETDTRLGHYERAIRYFERAYDPIDWSADLGDRLFRADVARRIGRLNMNLSNWNEAKGWMTRGQDLLNVETTDELSREERKSLGSGKALLSIHTGSVHYSEGHFSQALVHAEAGLALAEEAGSRAAIAEGSNLAGAIYDVQGDSRRALELYRRSYAIYEELGDRYHLARVGDNISTALFLLGEWDETARRDAVGLAFWRTSEDQDQIVHGLLNMGLLHTYRGEWTEAESHLEEARQIAQAADNHRFLSLAHINLGVLSLLRNEVEAGQDHFERSLAILDEHEIGDYLVEAHCGLAEAALLRERTADAQAHAKAAREMATEFEMRAEESIASRLLGMAYLQEGDVIACAICLAESFYIAQRHEIHFEEGRALLASAQLLASYGAKEAAKAYGEDALAIFQALRAAPFASAATDLLSGM